GGARIGGAEGPRPLAHRRPVRHRLRLRGAVERALGAADRRGGTGRGAARGRSHPPRGESLMSPSTLGIAIAFAILFFFFLSGVRIVNEYENGVVFRLGRFSGVKRGGFRWLIPFIERMVIVDMRTVARDVPPQDVITRDNVSVKVNAVVYFRVMQADKAVLQVEDYLYATSQLAQTTLRAILGQVELDELLANRERVNHDLQQVLDAHTDPWGVKVSNVEVKHIDIPSDMQRAIARQAEAERERRAKVISAEG